MLLRQLKILCLLFQQRDIKNARKIDDNIISPTIFCSSLCLSLVRVTFARRKIAGVSRFDVQKLRTKNYSNAKSKFHVRNQLSKLTYTKGDQKCHKLTHFVRFFCLFFMQTFFTHFPKIVIQKF